jgi:hypothetical protein
MSRSGEQHRAGTIEVAGRRAAYGKVTRVRSSDDVEASGADGEHSADMIAERPRRKPDGRQRSADR